MVLCIHVRVHNNLGAVCEVPAIESGSMHASALTKFVQWFGLSSGTL